MSNNPELLEQARQSLRDQATIAEQQRAADLICMGTRLTVAEILQNHVSHGAEITRSYRSRVAVLLCPPLLGLEVFRRKDSPHVWEDVDEVRWRTMLDGTIPEVSVLFRSRGGINPSQAYDLYVHVQGLAEYINYRSDGGFIRANYLNGFTDQCLRRANLGDAQKWDQLVRSLR